MVVVRPLDLQHRHRRGDTERLRLRTRRQHNLDRIADLDTGHHNPSGDTDAGVRRPRGG
jgi:hypothetical protein